MHTVTSTHLQVADLLNAIAADTTPKCVEQYEATHDTKQLYCALGGAANILDLDAYTLGDALISVRVKRGSHIVTNLFTEITFLNDDPNKNLSKPEIARRIAEQYPDLLDQEFTVDTYVE